MAKRFSSTEKWDDNWFCKLEPLEKLLFLFIIDKCDNAGFFELNPRLHSFTIGITSNEYSELFEKIEKSFLWSISREKIWVKNFLKHQKNLPLKSENNAHKQIIFLLQANFEKFEKLPDELEKLGADMGLFSPLGKGIVKVWYGNDKKKKKESDGIFYQIDKLSLIMQSQEIWHEDVARNFRCRIDFVKEKILDFIDHLKSQGIKGKTLDDATSHYSNWFNIQKENAQRNNKAGKKSGLNPNSILEGFRNEYPEHKFSN